MAKTQEIVGIITDIVYKNDGSSFRVARVQVTHMDGKRKRKQSWKLVGEFKGEPGDTISGKTELEYSSGYGYSLKALEMDLVQSSLDEDDSFTVFLARNIRGIGDKKARELLAYFGRDKLIELLDYGSSRLTELKGIGEATVEKIIESWQLHKAKRDIWPYVYDLGFGVGLTNLIIEEFGLDTKKIIEENPYKLIKIRGVSFEKADHVAMAHNGLDPLHRLRLVNAILFLLNNITSGNTYIPMEVLKVQLEVILHLDNPIEDELFNKTVEYMDDQDLLVLEKGNVFSKRLHMMEKYVAKRLIEMRYTSDIRIKRKIVDDFLDLYQNRSGIELTTTQRNAVYRSMQEGVMIITGGPGSGKTLTTGAIVELFHSQDLSVELCAPTGRAARRIKESTGFEANTIHRLLKPIGGTMTGLRFYHNTHNPLEADVVIVDEISMVDIELIGSLIRAIKPRAKLIMIGDKDQLPSIGPGNVLKDCLDSGRIPAINLMTIFRQEKESKIISNAMHINAGKFDLESGNDFFWIEKSDTHTLVKLVRDRIPAKFGIDPIDIKVITPYRRDIVDINVRAINRKLQDELNPKGMIVNGRGMSVSNEISYDSRVYRVGDPVMQLHNNYSKNIFNGDIGIVDEVDTDDEGRVSMIVDFGSDIGMILYTMEDLFEVDLAYATTIHKSQGSEHPAIIVIVPSEYERAASMLKRNLLYTAVTRAQKLCIIMSDRKSLKKAIEDDTYAQRLTMLSPWIVEIDNKVRKRYKLKRFAA